MPQVGGEDDGGLVIGGEDGEDIPGVGGDDEGGEEVELVGAVDDVAGADGADVGVVPLVEGAFDLHAAKEAVVVGGDVVGGGFSPGLVAAESALGGALHETELGPLSAKFGVRDVWAVGHRVFFVVVRVVVMILELVVCRRWSDRRLKSGLLAMRPLGVTKFIFSTECLCLVAGQVAGQVLGQ
ncbi:MAG: hypothetical protein WA198_22150 [Candidatus Sulfotelmatobacter sp.]